MLVLAPKADPVIVFRTQVGVSHATILELTGGSYQEEQARKRQGRLRKTKKAAT